MVCQLSYLNIERRKQSASTVHGTFAREDTRKWTLSEPRPASKLNSVPQSAHNEGISGQQILFILSK
jgi:hypothetical protein